MRLRSCLFLAALLSLPILMGACQSRPDRPAGGHFVERTLEFEGRSFRYAVFVPATAAARPLPVVLFLHGSGERGRDGHAQTTAGLGPWLRRNADSFPALVVMPQVPENEEWMGFNTRMALAALDTALAEGDGVADPPLAGAKGNHVGRAQVGQGIDLDALGVERPGLEGGILIGERGVEIRRRAPDQLVHQLG